MKILRVKQDYPTIQSAVDAAQPGDIILVESGIYNEQVTITKSNIMIIGAKGAVLDGQFRLSFGFILNGVTNVLIRSFTIKNYNLDGITCLIGSNNRIIRNRLMDNVEFGISTFTSPRNRIVENTVFGSGSYGMYLSGSSNSKVDGNRVSSNGSFGIYFTGGTGNDITNNCVYHNNSYGIVSTGSDALIRSNVVNGNLYIGIYASTNSIVENNEVYQNNNTGVYSPGSNNTIRENQVYKNGQDGIGVYGNNSAVLQNKVFRNKNNGIYIGSHLNVVGRNTAQENGVFDLVRVQPDNFLFDNVCCVSNPPGLCEQREAPHPEEEEELWIS